MAAPNRNTLWADIFVDELARAGLRAACIAPGSRSTPLTLALAKHPDIAIYSLLDERGAAYFALGLGLASGQPAALVCTSGTATANFYPAIIEANMAHVPLLVLTTDRPPELRHSGANQTIDQLKMYGDHVRWFVDVALPETTPLALRSVRTLAHRAVAATVGLPPGPVHLNFPFREPLEPTPVPNDVPATLPDTARPDRRPFTRVSRGVIAPTGEHIHGLLEAVQSARRGLIICGPRCPGGGFPEQVTALAQLAGFPLLADALSGVRFGPHATHAEGTILSGYETFLQKEVIAAWEPPDLIVRFGAMPISKLLNQYLAAHPTCRHLQFSHTGSWQDDTHTTSDFIWADPELTLLSLNRQLYMAPLPPRDTAWVNQFRRAEQLTWQTIAQTGNESWFEGAILADVTELLPHQALLFSASSLPVRHLDQFSAGNSTDFRVFANRGVSGIDGTIAAALGAAAAAQRPLALVSGDLAFYHDLNSLLAVKRCGVPITIVLMNNNGGGIFHRLPIANFEPPFTELFVTPHGLDFEPAVRMFGLDYARATSRADFRRLFGQSIASDTSRVIEVQTDSAQSEQTRRQIMWAVKQSITN